MFFVSAPRIRASRTRRVSPYSFAGLLALTLACRPEGYTPPQEPEPFVEPLPDDPAELTHRALYGTDLASPSILKPPPDADITPTGLTQVTLTPGTGTESPGPDDTVIMHYRGWDAQGRRFDDTQTHGQADHARMSTLAPGWAEALSTMVPGEKRRIWIPARLAFGPVPTPDRPNGDVVMEVELLDIVKALPPPVVPPDLNTPPRDAITTTTGLVYKVLSRGNGQRTPKPSERVLVHYSGWDMNGNLFDSSIMRGEPIAFGVDEVIPGWTEALQLMHEGDQIRVWIPGNLAYGDKPDNPNVPAGRLCFDVQLIQIQ